MRFGYRKEYTFIFKRNGEHWSSSFSEIIKIHPLFVVSEHRWQTKNSRIFPEMDIKQHV